MEGGTTILLLDPSNLAWPDLTYARGEMLRFLQSLPANELVGLYVMSAHGFQVLQEGTADHGLLASKLHGWMPRAQDLAQAQEMEQRNRQQFDYVLNPTDLQSVNGNINMAPDTAAMVDPQLRDNGSNPGRSAFPILAGVARHLASIPGHKNLVWAASDNVLADWSNQAVASDKGGKHIEGYVLRAQEALNDAHVSVYPLDASQLETNAIDPSLLGRNVQVAPSVTLPPGAQAGGQAPGRITAEMQQDVHPIQAAIQEMAEATGGRAFRRSGEIQKNLDEVIADVHAAYLLGFTPDTPADDQYHLLTVKLVALRGVTLRYRTGYEYAKEPATLKERFQRAVWQALDVSEIAVSANPVAASEGAKLKLNIATNDLALKQQAEHWVDKLDVFLIQRDDEGLHARITGQTLTLTLKQATYAKLLQEGIPFDQFVEKKQDTGSVRIVVVDENSGRMGSVTIPAAALRGKS
jgi:VWFA-related protein